MKRILSILIIMVLVLSTLTACAPKDKQYPEILSQLTGVWKLADDTDGGKYGVLISFNKDHTMLYGFDWSDFDDKASPDISDNTLTNAIESLGNTVSFSFSIENPSLIKVKSRVLVITTYDEIEFSIYKDSLTFNGYLYKRVS